MGITALGRQFFAESYLTTLLSSGMMRAEAVVRNE